MYPACYVLYYIYIENNNNNCVPLPSVENEEKNNNNNNNSIQLPEVSSEVVELTHVESSLLGV